MDPDSLFSLLMLFVLVCMGAFFSASETAFSSLNRIRMKNLADEGSKRAKLVLYLHDDFDKVLTTLLVGNNVATLAAAAISALLFIRWIGDMGATVSTVVLTVVIVLFGDITPKSLAKEFPEKIALAVAPVLQFFTILMAPFNYCFARWKLLLGRIVKTTSDEKGMTEQELYSVVAEAEHDGVIDEEDKQLIHNAIEFNDRRAGDILTPRMDIVGIPKDASETEIAKLFMETGYSRLPVYKESIDDIIGVVHMRDFFTFAFKKGTTWEAIVSPVPFVAPSSRISDLFKQLQREKSHLAVVTDEYGGTDGLVTMEDILEELVGDIWDETDEIIEEFVPLGENRHQVLGSAHIEDLFEYFNLPYEDESESSTVSGWIMDMLGKIPEEGDSFTFEGLSVRVTKTEQRRAVESIIEVAVAETETHRNEEEA